MLRDGGEGGNVCCRWGEVGFEGAVRGTSRCAGLANVEGDKSDFAVGGSFLGKWMGGLGGIIVRH
jgi:hypothetical protein